MKYFMLFGCLILSVIFIFSGCNEGQNQKEREATEKMMAEMQAQVGMPAITNFQEKKWAKMIFELRDKDNLITYAYITNMQGELVYLGQCIGYGLPYSVQYTAPESYQKVFSASWERLPQADPNGLYMPDGLSATWLMMLDPKTKEVRPVYVEPEIIVSPFKLHQ